ncbi:21403_t:CDS:1, partial [Gigaspora rosea]
MSSNNNALNFIFVDPSRRISRKKEIQSLNDEISSLKSKISSLEAEIASKNSKITSLEAEVSQLNFLAFPNFSVTHSRIS